jgi:hypothetical protein
MIYSCHVLARDCVSHAKWYSNSFITRSYKKKSSIEPKEGKLHLDLNLSITCHTLVAPSISN